MPEANLNNPLNRQILNAPLGGHPDILETLDCIGAGLPTDCRVKRSPLPYGDGYGCRMLARDGIIFAAAMGTQIWIRLPETVEVEEFPPSAVALNSEWVNLRAQPWERQHELLQYAYDYGTELAQKSPANKGVVPCPNCGQKLRAPNNRGALNLTCPTCKHSWLWTPS